MKNTILYYIPFEIDLLDFDKGSSVRINSLIVNFQNYANKNNLELVIIKGSQQERKLQLQEIDFFKIIYIYIELPNIPLLLSNANHKVTNPFVDIALLKLSSKYNIPIGAFLRDMYWKFEDMYPLKGVKGCFMKNMHELQLTILSRYLDVLFLPSIEMSKYLKQSFKRVVALPPGGEDRTKIIKFNEAHKLLKAIYVGSLHETANFYELYNAINKIDADKVQFTIVCRENEYKTINPIIRENLESKNNVKIIHAGYNDLPMLYQDIDFAILPYRKNTYNDFAMPLKLLEYFSYALPILSTNLNESMKFIKQNNIGLVTNGDNAKDIVNGINQMIEYVEHNHFNKEKINELFLSEHTWEKRISQISENLVKK